MYQITRPTWSRTISQSLRKVGAPLALGAWTMGYRIMAGFLSTTEPLSTKLSQLTVSRKNTTPFASFPDLPESCQRRQSSLSESARKRTRPAETDSSFPAPRQDSPDARSHAMRAQPSERQAPLSVPPRLPEQSHWAINSSGQIRLPVQMLPETEVVLMRPMEEGNNQDHRHQRRREDSSPFKTTLGRHQPTKTTVYQFRHHCPVSRRFFKRTKT